MKGGRSVFLSFFPPHGMKIDYTGIYLKGVFYGSENNLSDDQTGFILMQSEMQILFLRGYFRKPDSRFQRRDE